jgi:hypothetical protein
MSENFVDLTHAIAKDCGLCERCTRLTDPLDWADRLDRTNEYIDITQQQQQLFIDTLGSSNPTTSAFARRVSQINAGAMALESFGRTFAADMQRNFMDRALTPGCCDEHFSRTQLELP